MSRNGVENWYWVVESKNPDNLDTILADDVVFHSPVVHTPQAGKALCKAYLAAAMQTLSHDSFQYVREITSEREAMAEFTLELDGIFIDGIDIISWNDAGLITDFKVFIRPLKAINVVQQRMAELLQARAQ